MGDTRRTAAPGGRILAQQEQEQEQQHVGQDVVPPGVRTTVEEAEQVEPKCWVKRSIAVVSPSLGTRLVARRGTDEPSLTGSDGPLVW